MGLRLATFGRLSSAITALPQHRKKTSWICLDIAAFRPNKKNITNWTSHFGWKTYIELI